MEMNVEKQSNFHIKYLIEFISKLAIAASSASICYCCKIK